MLAAIYRTSGSSDVLEVTDVEAPDPGPGEVRVRVIVSGVNPTDWKAVRAGAGDESFSIPNQDGAGLIDAVGDGVDPSRVGQRVWILFAAWKRRWGTAASTPSCRPTMRSHCPTLRRTSSARRSGSRR